MALLDRLRPQPGWKHPDPAVRLAAVESLDASEQALLATIAREDEAPRVRRAAVAQLTEVDALAAVARGDSDDQVRADALERLTALASATDTDETIGAAAVAAIADERHLALVARSAAPVKVAAAAAARLQESKSLGAVARHAEHDVVRLDALGRLNDVAELEAVATHTEHKDVGLAALERLLELDQRRDTDTLDGIGVRARNKVVARRAKAIIKERAAADAEARALAEALTRRRTQLCEAAESLDRSLDRTRDVTRVTNEQARLTEDWQKLPPADAAAAQRWERAMERVRMHVEDLARQETLEAERRAALADAIGRRRALIDAAAAVTDEPIAERLAALRVDWEALEPLDAPEASALARDFARAVESVETRVATQARAAAVQERLTTLAAEIAEVAEADDREAVRPRWQALTAEWRDLTNGIPVDAAVHTQYSAASARWRERDQAARDAAARHASESQAQNHARLQELFDRANALVTATDTPIKDLDRIARDLRQALDAPGTLPDQANEELVPKLKALLGSLGPRLREMRETDEWRRWANAGIQEELCKRIEALREVSDLADVSRQLRDLRRQWKAVSSAPKDDADTLWQRFKTAADEAQARVDSHFATVAAEHSENLVKKQALCDQAEALAQSTDWIATAETLKKLQAEWQTIGAVPKDQAPELARRFRVACDTFFTRRKTDLAHRKEEWSTNQHAKEALCVRMEQLAESTDWVNTFNDIKKLQAEWKTIGPVRRNKSEALWKRFRGACDRFFERYGKRHEIDLQKKLEEREHVCRALEALAPSALAAAAAEAAAGATAGAGATTTARAAAAGAPSASTDEAAAAIGADGSSGEADASSVEAASGDAMSAAQAEDAAASDAATGAAQAADATDAAAADAAHAAADASAAAEAVAVPMPTAEELFTAVDQAWKRWRSAPGLPHEALAPVRARFESALNTLFTAYPEQFKGTIFDAEQTRRRMKQLCDDVENVTKGVVPTTQLGQTSAAALASLLKESLAANTIGGRVNEEAKARAAFERIRRAQQTWRDLGPVLGQEGHQLETRFHRACRRFFEQHPEFEQQSHHRPPRHGRPHGARPNQ